MRRHLPQSHDRLLTQTVAEVLLRRIPAQVFKRKDREHDARSLGFYLRVVDLRHIRDLTLEAISPAQHGLDILRIPGVISQRLADLSDGGVNAVIGIEVEVL